ncbi:hypothetical protein V6N13_104834 [Hibiscus sabdariffa]
MNSEGLKVSIASWGHGSGSILALEDKWGSFLALGVETRCMTRFDVAKMFIWVVNPLEVPERIKISSNGKEYVIKVSLGMSTKTEESVDPDFGFERYADVWPEFGREAGNGDGSSNKGGSSNRGRRLETSGFRS